MRTKTEIWNIEPDEREPQSTRHQEVERWYRKLASSQDQELKEYVKSLI